VEEACGIDTITITGLALKGEWDETA
jgi:hypothetical protein